MRRINLLPPEDRRRRGAVTTSTRNTIIGALLIAGAVLVLMMVGLYLFYYIRLGNEEERIAQLDQNIARQQTRIADLAPYRDLQARLDAKKPIADGIFRTRFVWDEFLRGLAFVIPSRTALDNFVGTATPINIEAPSGGAPEAQNLDPPGSIIFDGFALFDCEDPSNNEDKPCFRNVSDFLVRMNNLRFLANAELNTAELDRENFPEDAIVFEVAAGLVTRVGENGNEVLIENEPTNGDEVEGDIALQNNDGLEVGR